MRSTWALLALGLFVCLGTTLESESSRGRASSQLRAIRAAIDEYTTETSRPPGFEAPYEQTQAALYAALRREGGSARGPLLDWDDVDVGADARGRPVLLDPWGYPYGYWVDHAGYDLISAGPNCRFDTRPGGLVGDDLGYWGDGSTLQGRLPPALCLLLVGIALWLGFGFARWSWRRTRPRAPLELCVAARAATSLRCAWCHDDDPGEVLRRCTRCGVTLHPDCWAWNSRCPTLGCAPSGRRRVVILGR